MVNLKTLMLIKVKRKIEKIRIIFSIFLKLKKFLTNTGLLIYNRIYMDKIVSDFNKYSTEQQTLIKDMLWNKIIDNSTNKLNGNKSIVKGELNKLIISFVEKYNTKINVRTSMSNYKKEEKLINIPLYNIGNIENIVKKITE